MITVKKHKFIVKMQRPLGGSGFAVLIYNENRSAKYIEHNPTEEMMNLFGEEFKIFRYATLNSEGKIVIGEEAPWQDW